MGKKENAIKAIKYLDNWLRVNKELSDTPGYPMYQYLNDLADRVEEMFEIYEDGKLSSLSTDEYTATFQKDYI